MKQLFEKHYGLALSLSIALFAVLFCAVAYIAVDQTKKWRRTEGFESGCPRYTHEQHDALLGREFVQGDILTASRNVLILKAKYTGRVTCSQCHTVQWERERWYE